ncbi:MAG: YegS/Rv2252/BmrU family lipid kinase [Nocardioides sp.]|uniref:diacylglycerol/lipid kinase family protein n=1 Tax=Nocardioides sp. TaxID=35761 RepID=UPI0039E4A3FA
MTRRIALLANPAAGRGDAHRIQDDVLARLATAGEVELLVGSDVDDAVELARKAVADGVDTLVSLGGDGMLHLAIQAVAGSPTRLGVIPIGTGNDFARSVGLPTGDPLAAADVVVRGRTRTLDLGRSGDRWFATVMAAGFDAAVNARANAMRWPHGDLRYTLATFAVLRHWRPVDYTLCLDGVERRQQAMLLAIANTDSYGGGLRLPADARPDDGLLDVIIIKPVSKLEFLKVFPQVRTGAHVHHPAFERIRVRSLTLAAAQVTAYADGERFGPLPLTVECVAGAVDVLVDGPR